MTGYRDNLVYSLIDTLGVGAIELGYSVNKSYCYSNCASKIWLPFCSRQGVVFGTIEIIDNNFHFVHINFYVCFEHRLERYNYIKHNTRLAGHFTRLGQTVRHIWRPLILAFTWFKRLIFFKKTVTLHRKKRYTIFPELIDSYLQIKLKP